MSPVTNTKFNSVTAEKLVGLLHKSLETHGFMLSQQWQSALISGSPDETYIPVIFGQDLAGYFTVSSRKALGLFKITRITFNDVSIGHPLKSLFLELNQPIVGGWENVLRCFLNTPAQELLIPGVNADSVSAITEVSLTCGYTVTEYENLPFFEMLLSESWKDLLSANTRSNINRACKKMDQAGAKMSLAETVEDRERAFHALVRLHTDSWHERGMPGAFHDPAIRAFHLEMVRNNPQVQLRYWEIQNEIVAVLYNFRDTTTEYSYQSGFKKIAGVALGLFAHVRAMEAAYAENIKFYSHLAGGNQLKESLASSKTRLHWIRVQKKTPILIVEQLLKDIYAKVFRKTPGANPTKA